MNEQAPAGCRTAELLHRPSRTETADGLVLVGEHDLPSPPEVSRSDVVIVHGFGEHRGRYAGLVGSLVAAGHACHRFDLRGHGDSGGRRGHVDRFEDYRRDLVTFVDGAVRPLERPSSRPVARQTVRKGRPLVLLGHSLGGLIVLDTVRAHPALATMEVLSSPFLATAFDLPPLARPLLSLVRRLVPRAPLLRGPDPDGLSRDRAEVDAYRNDPRIVRRLTPAWALETVTAQERVFDRAGEITLPSLMLLGAADPIADPGRSRALFERLGGAGGAVDKRLLVYEGMRHEVFHELDHERVVRDLLTWLDERCPALPAPG